jgi:hypothetical protein
MKYYKLLSYILSPMIKNRTHVSDKESHSSDERTGISLKWSDLEYTEINVKIMCIFYLFNVK